MSGIQKSQKVKEPTELDTEIVVQSQSIEEAVEMITLNDAEKPSKFFDTKTFPDVIWQKIFGFLSLQDIKSNVARVCQHFYNISNDCVQEIAVDRKFFLLDRKSKMFDAVSTFQFLRTLKIVYTADPRVHSKLGTFCLI